MLTYRLYPKYRPFFPDYKGLPNAVDWHRPTKLSREELWFSVSSHKDGVNKTQFGNKVLSDGKILLTSSLTPRRELPTERRGWRLLMRVRLVPKNEIAPNLPHLQQYIDPQSEAAGW